MEGEIKRSKTGFNLWLGEKMESIVPHLTEGVRWNPSYLNDFDPDVRWKSGAVLGTMARLGTALILASFVSFAAHKTFVDGGLLWKNLQQN